MLVRYTVPGKYDHAEFGTICKVITSDHGNFDHYIQLQHAPEELDDWRKVGDVFCLIYRDRLEDKHFVDQMLRQFLSVGRVKEEDV